VRSVRRNGKVVQETVAQLGELDAEGRAKAQALARQITGRGDQGSLFEERRAGPATARVRLDRIRLERGRSFGDVWLGWTNEPNHAEDITGHFDTKIAALREHGSQLRKPEELEAMLRGWVEPLLAQNIDALVLGCTHYPFVIPTLEKICGPGVRVIDPAPAVARQVGRVLVSLDHAGEQGGLLRSGAGGLTYFTSGAPEDFRRALKQLGIEEGEVRAVNWGGDDIREK